MWSPLRRPCGRFCCVTLGGKMASKKSNSNKLSSKSYSSGVQEVPAGKSEINGFGDNVVKIIDSETGQVVCFIGKHKELTGDTEELIHFPLPVPIAIIGAVSELMEKRKMRKALDNGDYKKAQRFADKKVGDFFAKK